MAMIKGAAAGAAIGALGLATLLFVAPIAAQGPGSDGWRGAPTDRNSGPETRPSAPPAAGRGDSGPATTAPGPGRDRTENRDSRDGRDMAGRRAIDPNDPDITGPRGEFAACQQQLIARAQARLERIQRLTRPTDEQRPAFDELRTASMKGVEFLRSACPAEEPLTPPARMALAEKWLEARLQASKVVRPALDAYFRVLTDEQKIRWITGPRQWAGGLRGARRGWDRSGEDRWRGPEAWQEMRRGPEGWQGRSFDPRERFGFDGRRGDDERWGGLRRPDEQFGPYGQRDDERWRDGERYRWREPRWRDHSERDRFWGDQNWRDQSWGDQNWREQRDQSWREGAPSWREGVPAWREQPEREQNWREQNWREPPRRERGLRDQRFRDDRSTTGGADEERL